MKNTIFMPNIIIVYKRFRMNVIKLRILTQSRLTNLNNDKTGS